MAVPSSSGSAADPGRDGPDGGRRALGGRFPALLGLLCLLAFAGAFLLQRSALRHDPFARTPVLDALVYWEWAARIAGGAWVGTEPFFSAPLYPYLLGVLRSLGGDIAAVLALQAVLHAATVALIALAGRARFGPLVGLGAGALYALAFGPVVATVRILGGTLQVFLAALVLERCAALEARPTAVRVALVGLLYGLACLANPTLLVGLPLLALWLGLTASGWRSALLGTAAALFTVLPATVHNLRASGEPILVSAQAGLTFLHGNQPGARGVYRAVPGISTERQRQNADARARASEALGREATWRETSAWCRRRGLDWWRAEPGAAAAAGVRKAWYFLSGRHQGDIYVPSLERSEGLLPLSVLAPLRLAWLAPLALVAAVLLLRREPRRYLPEALLALLPLLVVVVFWYSPRYRLPAAPALALLAAWGLASIVRRREAPARAALLAAALALGLLSGAVNRAGGFDAPGDREAHFHQALGEILVREGDLGAARPHFERALELGHPGGEFGLADIERQQGDYSRAVRTTEAEARANPDDPRAWRVHAITLALAGRSEEAGAAFVKVLDLDPRDVEALSGLGTVMIGAGQVERGLALYDDAIAVDPGYLQARLNKGIALFQRDRLQEAAATMLAARDVAPGHEATRLLLADVAVRLATHRDDTVRDGALALAIADELCPDRACEDPKLLEALYLALAETGTFREAARVARGALRLLRERGEEDWARDVERYVESFERGEAVRD